MEPETPIVQPTPNPTLAPSSPSSSLLRNPMVWFGLGAVIIIFLGGLFLFSKESPQSTTATTEPTSVTTVMEPTGSIEIQEQKDADAIQVNDLDSDFTEIDQQVNQL